MATSFASVKRLYKLVNHSLFRIDGNPDYPKLRIACTALCNAIDTYQGGQENIRCIGEEDGLCLSDLVIAVYWHSEDYTETDDAGSMRLNAAVNKIYSPGITDGPEENSSASHAYSELNIKAYRWEIAMNNSTPFMLNEYPINNDGSDIVAEPMHTFSSKPDAVELGKVFQMQGIRVAVDDIEYLLEGFALPNSKQDIAYKLEPRQA